MITQEFLTPNSYDIVIVGAGIVGLASAYAAARQGLKVAVIERSAQCKDASIRNFGFVTVSGQRRGEHWQRANYARQVWAEIAPQAGINVIHQGLHMLIQRPEAMAVAEAFLQTEMGEGCRFLTPAEIQQQNPYFKPGLGVLYSPHELRVESATAIPKLTAWLQATYGIDIYTNTTVIGVALPYVHTSRGKVKTDYCVICPGGDLNSLYPETLAQANASLCTLNMMRVMPAKPFKLNGAVMSDLSFARYEGFAYLPEAQPLIQRLNQEQAEARGAGVHLIVVQSEDGSLVIGDSHEYSDKELPFRNTRLDDLILDEFYQVMAIDKVKILHHWLGVYPSAEDVVFKAKPEAGVVIGTITGGTGASTGFAFGAELIDMVLEN